MVNQCFNHGRRPVWVVAKPDRQATTLGEIQVAKHGEICSEQGEESSMWRPRTINNKIQEFGEGLCTAPMMTKL
jgi:hypothetical protein